ncbi:amine oxidase catalytic domain-containing protein [Vararia minispora EC-137]|uniref:Amine oxidase catalytic domain-containing protein n=1 Tax=Vararia minispora EC-137 TaxID=1314806 RepID=A0ACB8QS77_9AGAM|nr:amine oxidase catalytic domain-containing protein [Vararia minispora EC-137]
MSGYQQLKQEPDGVLTARRKFSPFRIALSTALVAFASNDVVVDNAAPLQKCASNAPLRAEPPAPVNLWAPLAVKEIAEVAEWLRAPERGLNLTSADDATLSDNVVFLIEAYRPRKADALAYLAHPVDVNLPARYARATVHHGGVPEPMIRDYLIGPLPISEKTSMRHLTEIYHRDDIPYNAGGFITQTKVNLLLGDIAPKLAEVTQELFGGVVLGRPNDTLVAGFNAPMSFDGSFRRTWINWRRNVPAPWLHAIAFWQYADISGTDPSQWKILKVVYNHQVYPSFESFIEAFHNGTLKRYPKRPDNADPSWSSRKPPTMQNKQRDLDHLPGPRSVSFAGLRFRVERKLQYISWMGWGMYLGFDRDMGLSLWDLRFRDERIIYELAPQEAMAQYAGNDPMQATTAWLDRFFGMGSATRDMIPGYDCPDEAVYFPATTFTGQATLYRPRAICIFETDTHRPITRHTGYEKDEFGAVKGYVLTVRSISTVGKYFDYIFHLDGTIEVRLSASGYLQGGFWEPEQDGYGAPIQATSMGSLHDHVINYKVDFDIAGLENSVLSTRTDVEEVEQPWFEDDWGSTVRQQKITRTVIENENDALLKYPPNLQGHFSVINQDAKNKWGIPRGYVVHPGYSPVHNTVVGSKRLLNNANWARYNLAFSKRKDTEPTSSSMWNLQLSGKPMVDFHNFFDGENITQADLVAWINVGTHHLPQAEDSPNTRTNVATSSFFLAPLNYFDADVSMESTNAIVLNHPSEPGGSFVFDDFGVKPAHCVPAPVPPFEYVGLTAYGPDGVETPAWETEELRKAAELYHRIKVEF